MAIATRLEEFLDSNSLSYDINAHEHAETGMRNAEAAHLPGDIVAKSVLLKDGDNYMLVVLPATHMLDLGQLHRKLDRHVGLATEEEVAQVFSDCQVGAIPPTGLLYDIDTIVDEALLSQPEIYFEAGDHEHLIHMQRDDFGKLMGDAIHLDISSHV
ncbi:aminoacyl-tRNA deacylase [Solemya velum gill symbiont]|uniref:YbaK/aminoacyl-tRNA synthetase-associated domain-containing protein n=2 Tax=Solemya velum gill symbiont TaxID=2340 RepID=A0A0B0H9Z2_SOVGS|nr:YbaK/EbsC family protein [Solemya velum gill symbiont]KHF25865.1 hypothetical protein JV46_19950 [Solemya velum gill symbiont]OOY34565.1 hypothetical protein BOV88_09695 [Solemya velum gill symbiont]OOY37280.1 hypothetical protein BOV89_08535 [Solemya velum gill symbiont]OOY40511.1 hypothetical protein BOV90_03830 [Solemya velum gill symbiont]OOY45773.1 hypothetical protein BOV92_04445 [Solemya velum gill symbiont]